MNDITGASLPQTLSPVNIVSSITEDNSALDTEQEKFSNFDDARIHLQRLIEDWHTEIEDTEVRRKTRNVEVDVEGLRQKGDMDEDETLIPVRIIDTNIIREQAPYINYLKNSRRICTFRSLDNPQQNSQLIEEEFSRGMTYSGWEIPHYKCLDGAQAHGWATVEVVFDQSKPLNVGLEYVAHDKFLFPRTAIDLQSSPYCCRAFDVTIMQLKRWVREFGFNQESVEQLIQSRRDTQKERETIRIYKLFFKKEGVVFVSWFALSDGVSDWLKSPVKLFLGIRHKQQVIAPNPSPTNIIPMQQQPQEEWVDSDIGMYPFFILQYRESEEDRIVDHKGRCFLDEPKQEAQTAVLSGFVNGLTRASNIYASVGQDDGTGSSLKEVNDIKLVGGRIFNKLIQFFSPPYPDPMVIKAMQYFDVANSEETNQTNFAAMNREDSRKTAKEIGAAQQQQQQINSVQLTLFSTHIRASYGLIWLIVQSQAAQNKIKFLLIEQQQPIINPLTQQPAIDPQTGQPATQSIWINDLPTIQQSWELRAAGDVDVIQRQEIEQKMQQDWPVIQNTPLAGEFLSDYVKLRYPDNGQRYSQILATAPQVEQLKGMVAQLGTILQGALQQDPKLMNELDPQSRSELANIMQQIQPLMGKQQPAK